MTPAELRAALRAAGLTQRALAQRLGLAISTVNRWALDKAPVPQYVVAYLEVVARVDRYIEARACNEKGRPKAP
jgi:transcriptional regulator with XRE-family HTH domain